MRSHALVAALAVTALASCNACRNEPSIRPRENQPNVRWCPGSPGCLAEGEATILAGAAGRVITPRGFEIANPRYLKSTGCDPLHVARFGVDRCGELHDGPIRDCGTDGLCAGDTGYTAPDADGTEANGVADWFYDCGLDRICPQVVGGRVTVSNTPEPEALRHNGVDDDGDGAIDDGEYPGPDEGEGDGRFTAAWIAGFGNNRPAMGVADDTEVRCFALRTNQTTTVHCSLDTIGFFYDEIERARAALKQRHPDADVDYLSVSSTHTHESVDTLGQWGRADPVPTTPGLLAGHNAFITQQIADAAAEAVGNLEAARLTLWKGGTGADGWIRDSRDPQVIDDTLTVVEARSLPALEPIFTVLHWANHPEVLSDDNNLLSSDFPSWLRRGVEQGFPQHDPPLPGRSGMAIYVNGTVGGLMTPLGVDFHGPDGTPWPAGNSRLGRNQAYGENLAIRALEIAQDPARGTSVEKGEIKVKAERYQVPMANKVFVFAFSAGLFDREVYDADGYVIDRSVTSLLDVPPHGLTEVFTLDLGPWSMIGVPGELFPEVAIGGYDGAYRFGRPMIRDDYCPDPSTCGPLTTCPLERPADGWQECECAACRLCMEPDLAAAPRAPYMKDQVPGAFKMVIGLANDEIGYMVPSYDFVVNDTSPYFCQAGGRHYEETNSTGPATVPLTQAAFQKLVDFTL